MEYSIIIPHKNVPNLLERCINSIPERSDIEVIVVDDNSTDDITDPQVLPSVSRDCVHIVRTYENKGAGFARNIGVSLARGNWILFADADDFFTDELGPILDKYAGNESYDLVYLNANSYVEETASIEEIRWNLYVRNYLKGTPFSEKVIRFQNWTPWTRMVKRELVTSHQILFEQIPVGNDAIFSLKCSQYARSIDVEPRIVYHYYKPQKGSVTKQYTYELKNALLRIDLSFRINSLYEAVNYPFRIEYSRFFVPRRHPSHSQKVIKEYLLKQNYSVTKGFMYFIVNSLAKMFRVL